ncbi:VOC family protein [soil metagenome]
MAGAQAKKIFVNLPVKDLDRSVDFFTKLGFKFNAQFTDKNATAMIVNDDAFVMLLVEEFFKSFTKKGITDATSQTEVIMALSAASKEDVDELVSKAFAAGGRPANDDQDQGFMYTRSFQDPDGHLWEVFWMDPTTIQQ